MSARHRPRAPHWFREVLRHPGGTFGVVVLGAVLAAAAVSLVWTPHPLLDADTAQSWLGPSTDHLLGTDRIGRDTLSWMLAGARTTVVVVVASTTLAGLVGLPLGALGSLLPPRIGEPVVVLIDILVAFPVLLLAIVLAAPFGGSLAVVVLAVGVGAGVNVARVTRPDIVRVSQSDYALAARAAGVGVVGRLVQHVLPNVAPVVIVQLSQVAGGAILAEAGLTYLGYGAPASTPSWGRTLADAQAYIGVAPMSVIWPGLAISLTVLALNRFGDALREAVDPRLRQGRVPGDAADAAGSALVAGETEVRPLAVVSGAGGHHLLEVQDLVVRFGERTVVDGVSFTLPAGERLGVIGESGSGKSLTMLAVLGLLPHDASVSGSIRWEGRELVGLDERALTAIRGREIGIVFQEPTTALNPIRTVGNQIGESARIHYGLCRREAWDRAVRLADRVRLPEPEHIVHRYPHQLSGGQRQRVAIAMALAAGPRLLIADEPTTALDVTVQRGIIELFDELVAGSGLSLVFVTHDIALLSQMSGTALVLANGRVVEHGPVARVVHAPRHPVTRDLAAAARATSWQPPVVVS